MNWTSPAHRLALARLLREGRLVRNEGTTSVIEHALAARWGTQTSRSREIALSPAGAEALPALLDRCWPAWRDVVQALQGLSLPLSPEGLSRLEQAFRLDDLDPHALPPCVNRRTIQARWGRHSKAPLPPEALEQLRPATLVTDDVVRLRPSRGLLLQLGDHTIDADQHAELLGELLLPERALLGGFSFAGRLPKAVLTVENLGAYIDLRLPPELLCVHLPGWNSPLALTLLAELPGVAHIHFGDLDPEGLAIFLHIRKRRARSVGWLVPEFWTELLVSHGLASR